MRRISDRHLLVEDRETGDHQRRIERIVPDTVGIKRIEPIHPAEVQRASRTLKAAMGLELVGLQPVRHGKILELMRLRIEPGKSVIGSYPKLAMIVLQDAEDHIAW